VSNDTSQINPVARDPVARVRNLLDPCVLLAIPLAKKGPSTKEWQKLTPAHMTPAYLASLNGSKNIGVSLGAASQGLCSIDVDNDDELDRFLSSQSLAPGKPHLPWRAWSEYLGPYRW
jgi:hypothetical protein